MPRSSSLLDYEITFISALKVGELRLAAEQVYGHGFSSILPRFSAKGRPSAARPLTVSMVPFLSLFTCQLLYAYELMTLFCL